MTASESWDSNRGTPCSIWSTLQSVPVAGGEWDALLGCGPVLVDVVDAEVVVGGEDGDVAVEGGARVELNLLHHQPRLAQEEALRDREGPDEKEQQFLVHLWLIQLFTVQWGTVYYV